MVLFPPSNSIETYAILYSKASDALNYEKGKWRMSQSLRDQGSLKI